MNESDLPDLRTHKFCSSCHWWFTDEYGSFQAPTPGTLFTPGALVRDIAASASRDRSHHFFVCYNCQHRKKVRRAYFFGALFALVALARLVKYLYES